MPEERRVEEEINLRDLINIILKRKIVILAFVFASVITAAALNSLQPSIYEASVSIMITPSGIPTAIKSTQMSLDMEKLVSAASKPTITVATHELLLMSDAVLGRLTARLGLKNNSGLKLAPQDIINKLKVIETKETNILQLQVKDADPKAAMDIANAWALEYVGYSQELISGEIKGTGEFITDQFEIARQNLVRAEEKIKDFKDAYKLDLMHAELDMKKVKLNEYKKQLMDLEFVLQTKEDYLKELKKEISKQEKFTIVSKAITDDLLWQEALRSKDVSALNKRKLSSEEINPIYQDLETLIVDSEIEINTVKPKKGYLNQSIKSTALETDELGKAINQKEFDLAQLARQAEIYKGTYDNLAQKIEEARLVKAAQLGEVKIVSLAVEPRLPSRQRGGLNLFVSGILGLVFGACLVFFMEYWQRSKTKT